MRAGGLGGLLALFTVLFLRNPTAVRSSDLPPLHNVTLMCDSYGVMLNWESSHPQNFNLKLIPNFGNVIHINTSDTQYNISEHLLDPAFNTYRVDVQTEDGNYTVTKLFTFNSKANVDGKTCYLTFPPAELIPGDYQLTVKFRNPFHLYRDTPALRKLQDKDNLKFSICKTNHSDPNQESCIESFKCAQESDMCEGTVPFPEEQEEYCVTVSGFIRLTYVQRTEPVCYRGSLKPPVPITVYIIPACVILGLVLIIVLMMLLAKKINRIFKEKIKSNLPDFLAETSYTQPFITLTPGDEPVERNPLVEPVTIIPINHDLPANSGEPPGACGCLIDFGDGCEQEAEVVVEAADHEDNVAAGGAAAGYDMPHGLLERRVEISPGDTVNTYKA